MAHQEQLTIGNGGWVRWMDSSLPAALLVRYVDMDGQLRPVDFFLEALPGETLTTNALRDVKLGHIDAWVNRPETAARVRSRLTIASSDLRRAARAFTSAPGTKTVDGAQVLLRRHWVDDMHWAQFHDGRVPQAPLKALKPLTEVPDEVIDAEVAAAWEAARLEVPTSKPYGDAFYQSVAGAYSALSRWTHKPAEEIATASGVHVRSVHNWIREARARGFLGAGRRGKVG